MRPNLQLFIILSIATVTICQQRYDLTSWDLNIEGVPNTFHITTPSTLSQNLINLQKVSRNPYYRDNFLQFYKYQTKSLLYTTTFTAPQNTTTKNYTSQIIFQGLDTHATVYLNGQKILTANNMFRKYIVNVNLHSSNKLVVQFQSAATHDVRKAKEFQNQYGFALPQNYSYSRKAAYQYGWDWGPRILTSGIWKDAYVLFGVPTTINNPIPILTTPITTKYPTTLSFNVTSQIHIPYASATYNISMLISRNNQFTWCDTYTATLYSNSTFKYNRPCQLTSSKVKNVSQYVWWTWDLGEPNMFNLTIRLQIGNNTPIQKRVLTGLKTVKVIQEKDTIGTSFTVNLNGYDIFIRGGNYIPPQMSMSQIPNTTYARIKTYSEFAKYNMIRVWGGGQFQHDEFYHVMDTAGILIWHDLMFACAMYPIVAGSDDAENIRMEMQDNLWRIGYHPSIGIWNGNNQVWIGWQEWGWKNKLDHLQIIQAQKMYKKIFSQTLPQVINHITPHIFYWQTSPSSSSNQPNTITSGDIHFWRVWGAGTDIQQYQIYVGRFNSEYGMQSMPEYSSILKYTAQQDRVLGSQVLRLHERHPLGDKYLPMYTNKYAGVTQDLKRFAYFSQVMQAYALQMAIVSLRGNKPYCMGSIYWQLNDVWPVSSWSTVDYYGQYKIAHYRIRQLHDQLLIHVVHTPRSDKGDQIFRAVAVNDYDKKISLFCVIRIMDFNGTILKNIYQVEKTVTNFQNIVLMRFDITPDLNRQRSFIHMDCKDAASGQNYTNIHYFVPPAQRVKLDPKLSVSALGNRLTIRAENLASYVWIRSKYEYDSHNFNKNYFDLLPGQEISVMLPIDANEAEVTCYQCEGLKEELEKRNKELKKRDETLQSE